MNERKRLIKLIQSAVDGCARHWAEVIADYLLANGVIVLDTSSVDVVTNRESIRTAFGMPLDELSDLIRAKQQGNLIVPPCKVGDTLYYISLGKIYKGKCHAITQHDDRLQIHLYDYDGDNASFSSTDVFLSREKAAKALERRKR